MPKNGTRKNKSCYSTKSKFIWPGLSNESVTNYFEVIDALILLSSSDWINDEHKSQYRKKLNELVKSQKHNFSKTDENCIINKIKAI
jgi:hypothetical protein